MLRLKLDEKNKENKKSTRTFLRRFSPRHNTTICQLPPEQKYAHRLRQQKQPIIITSYL